MEWLEEKIIKKKSTNNKKNVIKEGKQLMKTGSAKDGSLLLSSSTKLKIMTTHFLFISLMTNFIDNKFTVEETIDEIIDENIANNAELISILVND